ncbi:hypothetical protein [Pararhizobium sp. IMCC21322]|uniref:hypothetical protein n=1 Tax=Pararhizobium sp. IMCC21322 TaxID=3067903 RepID=UPI00274097D7|nr:hypothetical protein [Pararhizobium sp. IMCC21322]
MQIMYDPKEMERVKSARESFSGRLLSDPQFEEAMTITGIIEKEIQKTGRFKEKLGDYAFAFARTEKFETHKAEVAIRDLFKERTGMSMNDMRELLVKREETLSDTQKRSAFTAALQVGKMIEEGNKISFHRAFSHEARALGSDLNITDLGAKRLMTQQFEAVNGEKFYDWGKEQEKKFYTPQIEAEKQARKAGQSQQQTRGYARTR